jgi:glutathione-regulated potassium-efflux system ancillary protein KefC
MEHAVPGWLVNSFIYLSAAVIAVPLSKALGLGAIIGYLAAGIAIGPFGLGLVTNVEDILHFAEFGVVLMLFLVGLELDPSACGAMRRPIFGWGSAQVARLCAGAGGSRHGVRRALEDGAGRRLGLACPARPLRCR